MLTLAIISTVAYCIFYIWLDNTFVDRSPLIIYIIIVLAYIVVFYISAYEFIFYMNISCMVIGFTAKIIIDRYFNNKSKK